ncbi:MAG: 30S ribosomal protein S1 [Anaerolineales bacterium]|nr:30S ribosomal protein S1 [Anaerolineales bacterium]
MSILPPGVSQEPDNDHPMWEYINNGHNFSAPERGEIREGIILRIESRQIIVDVGAKRDAIVPEKDLERLSEEELTGLEPGQRIQAFIMNPMGHDEELVASINLALQQEDWNRSEVLLDNGDIVECEVSGYNKGGLLVFFGRLQGFVPASHIENFYARGGDRQRRLAEYVEKTLPLKVIEVDQNRRRLVLSNRKAQKEWEEEKRADLIEELESGEVRHGKVVGMADFGAFIKIDGATGLAHISELSWGQVNHPSEVMEVGDEVDAYVLDLDPERNRISLSLKRLQPNPWEGIEQRYFIGDAIQGRVVNVVDFGAFVEVEPGVEGLIHSSEMGTFEGQPDQIVSTEDEVAARVIHLDPDGQRMGLHLLDIVEEEAEEAAESEDSIAELEAESAEAEAEDLETEAPAEAEEPEIEDSIEVEETEAEVEMAKTAEPVLEPAG